MQEQEPPSEIGPWGAIKAEIIDKYLRAYLQIMYKRSWCRGTLYVDAFAGSLANQVRGTGELIPGSAKRSLSLQPGFSEYHFIDISEQKAKELSILASDDSRAFVYHGDGNEIIKSVILPKLEYQRFWRGVVLLDPYGMELDWEVVHQLGQCRSADVIINFPTMDMNRNALRRDPSNVYERSAARMTRWWGDESWRNEFYALHPQLDMFGDQATVKVVDNDDVVGAYAKRLQSVAGFTNVTRPLPVKNTINRTLYYLLLASQNLTAVKIMNDVLGKFR